MATLRNARVLRDGHGEYTRVSAMEEQYSHLQRCDPATDIIVAQCADEVVGYARTTWDDTVEGVRDHWLIVEADPAIAQLDEAMMSWCEERAQAVAATMTGARQLVTEALDGSSRQQQLVARGFSPLRYGAIMVRPTLADIPERPLPDGLTVRRVTEGALRAIWEADAEAFRDHRGYVEPTEQDWAMFCEAAGVQGTALWQVAWSSGEVVGQVRTYADPGDIELFGVRRAWTENISTRRAWRTQGVASALICASLRQLDELGFEQAILGVDTENPNGAFGLYESLGYAVVAMEAMYHRPI